MNWTLEFAPLIPLSVIAILAVASLAVTLLTLVYRPRGTFLRGLAYAFLCLALANPVLVSEQRRMLDSVVAVVVDESESQAIGDRRETSEAALEELTRDIADIEGLSARVAVVGSAGLQSREGTLAFDAMKSALADVPPDQVAGAILITDGQVHDVPMDLSELGFDAPIHGLITGRDNERDRRVAITQAPRFGIVGERDEITIVARDEPGGDDQPIPLIIKQDGEEIAREIVRPGQELAVPIEIDHAGDIYLTVEAEVLDGEITTINNRAVTVIEGIRETLRVLLVSGEPHAGERTWRNLLKSDAAVDLVHFTILRPPDKQDGTPINQLSLIAFPTRELFSIKIHEFDLIIFDRYQRRGVLPRIYLDNVARYVENGGAVLVASGPDYADVGSLYYTPLSDVLSAEPTGRVLSDAFHPRVTDVGARHPVTRDLPGSNTEPPSWSEWYRLVQAEASSGDVVMDGPSGDPLLLLERIGEGRIAILLSDHAWLWARGYQGGGPHLQLLRRLGHWLMKEPDLEEEAMTVKVDNGEVVLERRSVAGDVGEAVLTRPSGETEAVAWQEIEPGLWRSTYAAEEIGLYQVSDASLTALGHVGPVDSKEFSDFLSTSAVLQPIADETGGRIQRLYDRFDASEIQVPALSLIGETNRYGGRGWLGLRRTEASVLEGLNRYSLFSGFLGLAVLLGALSLMWYREGR